jgi:hypothetical protein
MASNCRVETTSYGYRNSINSVTNANSNGDSPHAEFIGGVTAGEIGKGHAMGHANYLARIKTMEIYTGESSGNANGNGDMGLSDIKDVLGVVKTFLG